MEHLQEFASPNMGKNARKHESSAQVANILRAASNSGSAAPLAAQAAQWMNTLAHEALSPQTDAAALIEALGQLEQLKSAASACQARLAVVFDANQRRAQSAAGTASAEIGLGIGAQIALARKESPHRGNRLLGLAKALIGEMPHTFAALATGGINEWRATLMVKETACLSIEDRQRADEELAADTGGLDGLGDRKLVGKLRAISYRLDPQSVVNRAAKAANNRFVSIRPAPDTMVYLTALLPVAVGVSAFAALSKMADAATAAGDERGRGQLMADELITRVTGTPRGYSSIEVQLIMTDRTLLAGNSEAAILPGYGVIPGATARQLLDSTQDASHEEPEVRAWIRKLYTAPGASQLIGMESNARIFPPAMRRFIQTRDQSCRRPYCDAPIRHRDHITSWADGGPTTADNGAGLCEACNHTKEAPGWSSKPRPGPRHTFEIITPTGHVYESMAPPLPGD